ncbi:hypothetical protein ACOQNR_01295, partial [Pseudomonas juntendi]
VFSRQNSLYWVSFRSAATHCAQGLSNVLALMAKSLSAVRSGRSFARQRKRAASRGCEGYKPTR